MRLRVEGDWLCTDMYCLCRGTSGECTIRLVALTGKHDHLMTALQQEQEHSLHRSPRSPIGIIHYMGSHISSVSKHFRPKFHTDKFHGILNILNPYFKNSWLQHNNNVKTIFSAGITELASSVMLQIMALA